MRNQSLFVKKLIALAMALMFLFASSAVRVEATTTPAPALTKEQIEAIVEEVYNGFATFEVQQVVSRFAADATVEDPVGTPPMQGTQAITTARDHLAACTSLRRSTSRVSREIIKDTE